MSPQRVQARGVRQPRVSVASQFTDSSDPTSTSCAAVDAQLQSLRGRGTIETVRVCTHCDEPTGTASGATAPASGRNLDVCVAGAALTHLGRPGHSSQHGIGGSTQRSAAARNRLAAVRVRRVGSIPIERRKFKVRPVDAEHGFPFPVLERRSPSHRTREWHHRACDPPPSTGTSLPGECCAARGRRRANRRAPATRRREALRPVV